MGKWFAKFAKDRGWNVSISDKNRERAERVAEEIGGELAEDNLDAVAGADIALISVPILETPDVITEVSEALDGNTLLLDVASVKEKPVEKMKSIKTGAELASIHPLFGPGAEKLRNKNIIAVPVEVGEKYENFKELLLEEGANVGEMEANEHDRLMAITQGLTHFTLLTYISALDSMKGSEKALEFQTPMLNRLLDLTKAFLKENPKICMDIQTENKYSHVARSALLEACQSLDEAIEAENTEMMEELFENTRKKLGLKEIEEAYENLYKGMEDKK